MSTIFGNGQKYNSAWVCIPVILRALVPAVFFAWVMVQGEGMWSASMWSTLIEDRIQLFVFSGFLAIGIAFCVEAFALSTYTIVSMSLDKQRRESHTMEFRLVFHTTYITTFVCCLSLFAVLCMGVGQYAFSELWFGGFAFGGGALLMVCLTWMQKDQSERNGVKFSSFKDIGYVVALEGMIIAPVMLFFVPFDRTFV